MENKICQYPNDHDNLTRIIGTVKDLTDISKDHETRLRTLEKYGFMVLGGVSILSLGLNVIVLLK